MEEKKQKKRHQLGWIALIILVILAIIGDVIGLIPLAKDITATLYWGGASFYMWKRGMGIFNGKKLGVMAVSWVSGMIPFLQELPFELLAGILAIFIISRIEDKTGISVLKPLHGGKKVNLPKRPLPLNQGGSRQPRMEQEEMNI